MKEAPSKPLITSGLLCGLENRDAEVSSILANSCTWCPVLRNHEESTWGRCIGFGGDYFYFPFSIYVGFSLVVLVCLIVFCVKAKGKKCDVTCIITSFPKLCILIFISGARLLSAEGRWP